jgi:DNA polymerase-1
MTTLVFDVEGDGFVDAATTIHCVVVADAETGEIERYRGAAVGAGIARLAMADEVVAHNGVGYDLPVLARLHGFKAKKRFDTMVMARLYAPDRNGGHSIEAYGEKYGIPKIGTEITDYSVWTQEIEDRCARDVEITLRLWRDVRHRVAGWGEAVELEHQFAELIALQMRNGFSLDVQAAQMIAAECLDELNQITDDLRAAFPPIYVAGKVVTPKADNRRFGYAKGASFMKVEIEEFNPGSGQQIGRRLIRKHGWKPVKFTESGIPATDEDVLKELPYPEAKLLARFMRVSKMWKQIAAPKKKDGSGGGWLWHVDQKTGRVHGYVNSCGAVTRRCTHSKPNTANVDKKDTRLRAVWGPRPGWVLTGADADGLELRMLAHYLAKYDGGAYARSVVEGTKEAETDCHSLTRKIVGLIKRDNAKRVIYALLYGAGDGKLGLIIIEDALEHDAYTPEKAPHLFKTNKRGKVVKRTAADLGADARGKLETGIVGLGELRKSLERAVTRGYLITLDGGHINIRSAHAALNSLLQGGGAIVMKKAAVLAYERYAASGLTHFVDYGFCANVHDEVQIESPAEHAEFLGRTFVECITAAGEHFNLRCPLAGSFQTGASWAATH